MDSILTILASAAVHEILTALAATIISVVVPWGFKILRERWGLEIEARHREALQSALENGVRSGLQRVGTPKAVTPTIQGQVIEAAAEYVKRSVPDALDNFHISESKLRELIIPHLPFPFNVIGGIIGGAAGKP